MASKSKNDSGFIVLDFWILFGTSLSMIWYPTFYKVGIIGRVAKRPLATTTKNQNTQQPTWAAAALPPSGFARRGGTHKK